MSKDRPSGTRQQTDTPDRRHFLQATAGVLAATGLSSACASHGFDFTNPGPGGGGSTTGSGRLIINGVDVSAADAGSVTSSALPGLNVTVPKTGSDLISGLAPGTYDATYTPPANHTITNLSVSIPADSTLAIASNKVAGNITLLAGTELDITVTLSFQAPGGGAGAISGTVKLTAGTGVPGGFVERIDASGNVLEAVPIGVGGAYTFPSPPAGANILRVQPAHTHNLAAGEPDTVTVNAGTNHDFLVELAYFYDDFQSYADTAALKNTTTGFGAITPFVNSTAFHIAAGGAVDIDPTGGPNGDRAMKYSWPDRTGLNTNFTVGTETVVRSTSRAPSPSGEIWVRFMSKETAGFHIGDLASNTSMAYKYIRIFTEPTGGGADCDFGWNPTGNAQTTGFSATTMTAFMEDPINGVHFNQSVNLGAAGTVFDGNWHTHVLHVTGMGSANCMFSIYRDGVLLLTMGPFLINGPPNNFHSVSWGDVMNNGPNQAQNRWFREVGIYFRRPSTRLGLL